jgi:hypothetical protein
VITAPGIIVIPIAIIATIGISTGTIAVTIMAITIAIIIVVMISGAIPRAPIIGVDTVHSSITRGRPSGMSMTGITSRATELAAITDTTPIRSSSVIMIIGVCMNRLTATIGCMIMTAETQSWLQLPRVPSSDWSSAPSPIRTAQPTKRSENAHGSRSVGIFSGHSSIFYDVRPTFIFR